MDLITYLVTTSRKGFVGRIWAYLIVPRDCCLPKSFVPVLSADTQILNRVLTRPWTNFYTCVRRHWVWTKSAISMRNTLSFRSWVQEYKVWLLPRRWRIPAWNESFIKSRKSRMRQAQNHRVRMRKHADKVLEEVGYHISFQFTKVRHRHNGSNDIMFSLNKSDLGPSIRFFCATFIERGRAPHRKQDTETTRLPCVCMQNSPPPPKNEHALKDFLCVANMRQLLHAAN